MTARRALYWALWPLEKAFDFLAWTGRLLWALIVASHPALLAMWILRRDKRRQEEDK
uniref:Uncharacterized protein n=1 Tax=viral metagenome TaxID=1070528 RepID=A0A6M3LUD2_9ZZZZ